MDDDCDGGGSFAWKQGGTPRDTGLLAYCMLLSAAPPIIRHGVRQLISHVPNVAFWLESYSEEWRPPVPPGISR